MLSIKAHIKPIFLILSVSFVFVGSGLFHIDKFETSDEHFWRLERIPQYWDAIIHNNFTNTYINDKPGVSTALISGTGLLFVSQDKSDYNSIQDYTMTLNYALRLPLLLFNGLVMMPLLFWLMIQAFGNRIASIGIILVGINPILIGISQIINPDALLWSFSAGAIFSFFALLKTNEKKFIVVTGVLTGFALLSKYTANLLFVFYIIIGGAWLIYEQIPNIEKWLRNLLINFISIFLVAITIFAIFLPAVILDSSLFLYGTILSPTLKPIIIPLVVAISLIAIDAFFLNARIITFVTKFLRKIKKPILYIPAISLLFLILFALVNAWTDASFITLDNLKEVIADTQELQFPMFEGLPAPIYFLGEILVQSFNILFSLTPLIFIFSIVTIFFLFFKKIPNRYYTILIFCTTIPFLFFIGGIISETFVNIRYAIILQPLFALLASIGLSIIIPSKKYFFTFTIIIIIFIQGISVYLSSPYYFNYQNIFLPQKFVLTDSWSYGIFEATQYLNSLPDARNMTIWSDRKAACYYFVGNCIMSRKIDANKQLPDYFIVTRRGVLRHHFKWSDIFTAPYSVDTIYSDKILSNPLWQFNILDRRENYIKIIDAHNLSDLSFVDDVENMPRPIFPDTICNITNFGAQSTLTRKQIDAKEDVAIIDNEKKENAQAFEEAIRECSEKGGGTIEVPSGLWYTKAIHLKNNINLHLSKDATILFSDDPDDFLPVVKTRFIGLDVYNYSPMIYVQNAQNIAITGTGTIDGNGKTPIWDSFIGNQKKPIRKLYNMSLNNVPIEDRVFGTIEDALRPSLIQFYNSKNILIDGIKIIGGPMWTIHPVYSKNIIIQNTDIKTLASNGDGIAIDSSENILIKNNILSTTDDAIVIKSGRDEDGWTQNKPSQNIVIRDNVVTHAHAGVGFGSEMSAGIQNVFVDNMQISNADRGFRLKTTLGRGGFIKNITIQNSTIINPGIKDALSLNMNYGSSTIKPKTKKIPEFKNISFKNITITMTQKTNYHDIIIVDGIKNNLSHILFDNIKTNDENATTTIKNSEQIRFNNVKNANYFIKNSKDIIIINDRCSAITQKNSKNISHLCEE